MGNIRGKSKKNRSKQDSRANGANGTTGTRCATHGSLGPRDTPRVLTGFRILLDARPTCVAHKAPSQPSTKTTPALGVSGAIFPAILQANAAQ